MLKSLTKPITSITGAAVIVASFSILSRFAGFIRDRILAGAFGAGDELDVYFAAFKLPDMLFQFIIVGALSASFIPLFTKYYARGEEGKERAWHFANNALHFVLIVFIIVVAIGIGFAEPFAQWIAPGFSPEKQAQVAELSRIMFAGQLVLALSMIFGSILQGLKRFFLASIAPIFYNVGIILGAVFLVDRIGITGLAWGVFLGTVLHLLVQLAGAIFAGYRYRPVISFLNKDIKYIMKHMVPRVLGLSVNQLNFIAMTIFVTALPAGSLTILQFAYNLNFFPVGVIGVSFAIAAFPALSEAAEEKTKYLITFTSTAKQILLFSVPAMIVFIALRAQIVRVVLGAGEFNWPSTIATADTMGLFIASLAAQSLVFLLVRGFFALEDTITPFIVGLLSAGINIGLIVLLIDSQGILSFGIAYSVSSVVQFVLLWGLLRFKIGPMREKEILKSAITFVFSGSIATVVIQAIKLVIGSNVELDTFWLIFGQGAAAGTVGILLYFFLNYALKNPETMAFVSALHGKLLKRPVASETVISDVS